MSPETFQQLVDRYYAPLYRFGLSLSGNVDAASDLVQQTFFLWAEKGHQLRDHSKAKSWLFTALYREYLSTYRRNMRFPQVELEDAGADLPVIEPEAFKEIDGSTVVRALNEVDEVFRAPLTLFYLEELSYKEIAGVLEVPIGTVMSRLARGKEQLRRLLLAQREATVQQKLVMFPKKKGAAQ